MRHLIPIIGLLIEELVNSFINNIYKLYSVLSIIISNTLDLCLEVIHYFYSSGPVNHFSWVKTLNLLN